MGAIPAKFEKVYNPNAIGLKKLSARMKDIGVLVGILKENNEEYEDGVKVALVALWNEIGTSKIPPRPFLRTAIIENKRNYQRLFKKLLRAYLKGILSKDQLIETLGRRAVNDVRKRIDVIKTPSNAPLTIEQKGFDNPLVWTGRLRASIDYKSE